MLEQPQAGRLRPASCTGTTSRRFSIEPVPGQSGTSGTRLFRSEAAAYDLRRRQTTGPQDRAL